jgi:hypothetical protein
LQFRREGLVCREGLPALDGEERGFAVYVAARMIANERHGHYPGDRYGPLQDSSAEITMLEIPEYAFSGRAISAFST